jgi:hypothetical protein
MTGYHLISRAVADEPQTGGESKAPGLVGVCSVKGLIFSNPFLGCGPALCLFKNVSFELAGSWQLL